MYTIKSVDKKLYWVYYRHNLGIARDNKLNLDFIEAIFVSGLGVSKVFTAPEDETIISTEMFDKFFTS